MPDLGARRAARELQEDCGDELGEVLRLHLLGIDNEEQRRLGQQGYRLELLDAEQQGRAVGRGPRHLFGAHHAIS